MTTQDERSAPETEGTSSVPSTEPTPRNPMRQLAATTGHALATAGIWVGRSAAAAYHAVDPDLRLHLAQLPLLGLTMLARGQASPEPLPDDGRRPVVFVHGLGGGPGNFLPMRLYFKLMGRSRSYAVAFPGATTITDMASRLAGFLEEVVTANVLPHDAQVDIVAHSMGGLAVRLALEDEKTRARVATLVTMATPHAGSHLARYGAMPSSLDLRPGSDVLARLARQLPWRGPPEQPRLVALWSAADVILLPARSATVEGAENVELQGFTHYGYLIHPSGWRRVLEALDKE